MTRGGALCCCDVAALVAALQAEQREKERRQKEKQEAHLYCHVRIATDQDIAEQVSDGEADLAAVLALHVGGRPAGSCCC